MQNNMVKYHSFIQYIHTLIYFLTQKFFSIIEFEDMKVRITYIIWRFIKHEPDIWRLMDARFDVMAKIIIGGSNMLVKYILFGDENRNLHVPRLPLHRWEDKEEYNLKEHYRKARGERM